MKVRQRGRSSWVTLEEVTMQTRAPAMLAAQMNGK